MRSEQTPSLSPTQNPCYSRGHAYPFAGNTEEIRAKEVTSWPIPPRLKTNWNARRSNGPPAKQPPPKPPGPGRAASRRRRSRNWRAAFPSVKPQHRRQDGLGLAGMCAGNRQPESHLSRKWPLFVECSWACLTGPASQDENLHGEILILKTPAKKSGSGEPFLTHNTRFKGDWENCPAETTCCLQVYR